MRPAIYGILISLISASAYGQSTKPLSQDDITWLRRDGFDLNADSISKFESLGKQRLLDQQLSGQSNDAVPQKIQMLLDGYDAYHTPASSLINIFRNEQKRIQEMPDGEQKIAAKRALQKRNADLLWQAQKTVMLHAIYGPNQLKEQMVLFWLNHFSIYGAKGYARVLANDYVENTIRPHALGKFKDLVMATLQSPAMLVFLDNMQNAKGHVNENYARELMELHTLGVNSGYTQQDVQQLALILTGAGIKLDERARSASPKLQKLYLSKGLFDFNPVRHDFTDKTLLGQHIRGSGFQEIEQAVTLITRQPACAKFISRKIASYFVADNPPTALVERMAQTFQRTDGDISEVLRTLFESKEITAGASRKFKDPMQFVVSSIRIVYDNKPIADPTPLLGWLYQLNESTFGRITPDGWPLDAANWSGSGQMATRFEVARSIGSGRSKLFGTPDGTNPDASAPKISPAIYKAIQPTLSKGTQAALNKARNPTEWNTFLLSSPDFNYR